MGKKKEPVPPIDMGVTAATGGGGSSLNPAKEAGYAEFAQTGGFSPEAISNIRSRALSPVRAVYSNAMQGVQRQRALQGGYSPNATATMAKMAREQSSQASDAATNAEAGLSEMVQKGRLAGLAGMSDGTGGGGGTGGGSVPIVPAENPVKRGFWGKLGGGLAKVGKVALPIALNYMTGGVGGGVLKAGGNLSKVAKAAGGQS